MQLNQLAQDPIYREKELNVEPGQHQGAFGSYRGNIVFRRFGVISGHLCAHCTTKMPFLQ